MERIKDFGQFLFEAASANPLSIADSIQKAAGGLGTDENLLVSSISSIPNSDTLVKVNQILSGNTKYSYKSVGDAINGELGFLDGDYKNKIQSHIKKIGAQQYITSVSLPPKFYPSEDVIKEIIPRVKQHEGVKPKKYLDSKGIPTVGVGFNLNRKDADQKLKSVGANPAKVKKGIQALTVNQIDKLLAEDLKASKVEANKLVGNLAAHPKGVQGVLIEMVFNLGSKGLSGFKNFLSAIKTKKYKTAAKEMLSSSWSKQVGNRAKTLSKIISSAQG